VRSTLSNLSITHSFKALQTLHYGFVFSRFRQCRPGKWPSAIDTTESPGNTSLRD
jgi:hypothetical protein